MPLFHEAKANSENWAISCDSDLWRLLQCGDHFDLLRLAQGESAWNWFYLFGRCPYCDVLDFDRFTRHMHSHVCPCSHPLARIRQTSLRLYLLDWGSSWHRLTFGQLLLPLWGHQARDFFPLYDLQQMRGTLRSSLPLHEQLSRIQKPQVLHHIYLHVLVLLTNSSVRDLPTFHWDIQSDGLVVPIHRLHVYSQYLADHTSRASLRTPVAPAVWHTLQEAQEATPIHQHAGLLRSHDEFVWRRSNDLKLIHVCQLNQGNSCTDNKQISYPSRKLKQHQRQKHGQLRLHPLARNWWLLLR